MNVSLPEELANFVKDKVSTGRYGSASEVVREALRLMERTEHAGSREARIAAPSLEGRGRERRGREVDLMALKRGSARSIRRLEAQGVSRVRFTARAREDLLEIWVAVATRNSEAVADRVYDRIENLCHLLEDHPQLGRARPEIHPEARSIVVERWLALYRITEEGTQIVRVLDGARDLSTLEWPAG